MFKQIIAIVLLAAFAPAAMAQQQEQEWIRPVVCCEDRIGCQVLQMVMMGSFDSFDPQQPLSVRVLSAAFPKLQAVTNEDILHFVNEFRVEEEVLQKEYFAALSYCLWADILMAESEDAEEEEARQVLLLFLDPSSMADAEQQMEAIRLVINEDVYAQLADRTGLETAFIRYLIENDNWRDTVNSV